MTKNDTPHPCPDCGSPLRQLIHLVIDCPTGQRSLDKKAIRSKDIEITAALWDQATIYCTKCSYHWRFKRETKRVDIKQLTTSHSKVSK